MSRPPVFLDRRRYRRRRAIDALRLLPVIGGLLFLAPLIWGAAFDGGFDTARSGLFLFGVWGGMILAAAIFARVIEGGDLAPDASDAQGRPGDDEQDP